MHYKDKKTFCFFCDKDVSHFSRHLSTWHRNEIEVQRLHSHKINSKERRQALNILGKRGNYVKNRSTSQLRPVRRVTFGIPSTNNEFLPCPHCLGFYKKKYLYVTVNHCQNKERGNIFKVKAKLPCFWGNSNMMSCYIKNYFRG